MIQIVPTVTAQNAHIYREEIERVQEFAKRIHIDLADGDFAPTKMVNPVQAWWPEDVTADIHLMYRRPQEHIETLISLQPDLVVLHAESEGNILGLLRELKVADIKAGLALLANSQPEDYANEITEADHVLVFGGKLGYHGGQAQLEYLQKVPRIKALNTKAEISWDGGVNAENAKKMAEAGIQVLNVGGFVQRAKNPAEAYKQLVVATS